jgi:hypothetical protein
MLANTTTLMMTLTTTSPSATEQGENTTSNCLIYYIVVKGDYCYDIWTHFQISEAQFRSYNPLLTLENCQIYPHQLLCVRQGPPGRVTTVTTLPDLPTSTQSLGTTSTSETMLADAKTPTGINFYLTTTTLLYSISPTVTLYTTVAAGPTSTTPSHTPFVTAAASQPCAVLRNCGK